MAREKQSRQGRLGQETPLSLQTEGPSDWRAKILSCCGHQSPLLIQVLSMSASLPWEAQRAERGGQDQKAWLSGSDSTLTPT